MTTQHKTIIAREEVKPRIVITPSDYEGLSRLARAAAKTMPDPVSLLTEELERAHVLSDEYLDRTVCMGSEVEFRDDTTGQIQTVTLVYPGSADIERRRISVLTPIGTALIGLSTDDSITWETRNGELRQLTVLNVRKPQVA